MSCCDCWTMIFLFFTAWTFVLQGADGSMKVWKPNTDWQDGSNWLGEKVPCSHSVAVFPEDVVVSVLANGNASWATVILPANGELILEDGWSLGDAHDDCPQTEVHFEVATQRSWFAVNNWILYDKDDRVTDVSPVPHSERIPCRQDVVILPQKHSFSIDFHRAPQIHIGRLKYGEQEVTGTEADTFLQNPLMKYQVLNAAQSFQVSVQQCEDPIGCPCGNMQDNKVMQLVCSNAALLCSNGLQCSDSFRPPGHCCDMCGAMAKLTVDDAQFTKTSLELLLSSFSKQYNAATHIYRTSNETVHVTISDNNTNELSLQMARLLDSYFKSGDNLRLHGIRSAQVILSGLSYPGGGHVTPAELRLIVSNLMTVLATLVIIALAIATSWYYKRNRTVSSDGFTVGFARFQNDGANVEIGMDIGFQQAMERDPSFDTSMSTCSTAEVVSMAPAEPGTPLVAREQKHGHVESSESPQERSVAVKEKTWKKLARAFDNPLFGVPSTTRLSGRWSMSSLVKSATQENPIFNVAIPEAEVPEPSTLSDPVTQDKEVGSIDDPDHNAVREDCVKDAGPDMDDVNLDENHEAKDENEVIASSKKVKDAPLKRFWKKTIHKLTPVDAGQNSDEPQKPVRVLGRQGDDDDQVQLTLDEHEDD